MLNLLVSLYNEKSDLFSFDAIWSKNVLRANVKAFCESHFWLDQRIAILFRKQTDMDRQTYMYLHTYVAQIVIARATLYVMSRVEMEDFSCIFFFSSS